ncbi:MAG TPA: helix-turn-helix domain-containing protein [Candidatus Pygmaiobacter gallistercoris]|nr:helix-turn-helix domain-containing protein [Candidatus Pygmaiobacter gallistercoris]
MDLSNSIKAAREQQGLSQEEIAEKLRVSRQAVSRWETGQSEPSPKNLLQLAELLGLDPDRLRGARREQMPSAKERIVQKGLSTLLSKRNAVLLTAACTAQMAIFCVNQEQVSGQAYLFRYLMAAACAILMILLFRNIWLFTDRSVRGRLYARIFIFSLSFELLLILSSRYLGGLIAFVLSVVFLVSLIRVYVPEKSKP